MLVDPFWDWPNVLAREEIVHDCVIDRFLSWSFSLFEESIDILKIMGVLQMVGIVFLSKWMEILSKESEFLQVFDFVWVNGVLAVVELDNGAVGISDSVVVSYFEAF